ncbi:hypothetical protein DPV78_003461 [Talaromyces pinophilus]|nr:hypothetical protein DPV78_003461 [Talaromyces pinophilus]
MLPFPCSSYRKSIPRAIDTSTLFLANIIYILTPVYGSQHRPGLRSSSAESHASDGSLPKTRTGAHLQFRSVGHLGSLGRVCLRDVHSISPCRHLSKFAH